MDKWQVAVATGVVLIVVGGMMMRRHVAVWNKQKHDDSLSEADHKHYYARYRRRMQTSGLIALLGVLIPAGDVLFSFVIKNEPGLFAAYWLGVLVLTAWVILLGVGDFVSVSAHSRIALNQVRREQRELERQIAEIKRRSSNGRGTHD